MFKGQYTHTIDAKGRLSIPSKLRKSVSVSSDQFVMTKGTAPCIEIYPADEWKTIEEKLLKLNPFKPEEALFIRLITQYATDDTLDSQSRILIPPPLLDYASIEKEKDVLILGALKRIEVWNPVKYDEYLKRFNESYEEIAAKVMS
ncbi:MAG: division/cell wall cluster transcriptional repressor MraZ [Ignavibacteriaceae bacterium]|nr:division/cell wall cluster transcriptional repressor MraZ [Ignavibacteriaceae bacterium]